MVTIRRAQSRAEIVFLFHSYLTSIEDFDSELLPTRENAERWTDLVFMQAWQAGDPILVAECGGVVCGATFTTLPIPGLEFRHPYATGHGTWVHPSHRKKGIARKLIGAVREELRRKGIPWQMGMTHKGNVASLTAFGKMGFTVHGFVLKAEV